MSQLVIQPPPVSLESMLVMSSSGLLLFRRDFHNVAQTPISPTLTPSASSNVNVSSSSANSSNVNSMQASVLATLVDVSLHATSLPLSFILLNSKAIAVASQAGIIFALYFSLLPGPAQGASSSPSMTALPAASASASATLLQQQQNSYAMDEDNMILFRSFAATLANTLLSSFISIFPSLEMRGIVASRDFDAFSTRIPDALRATAKQILNELSLDAAISNCILVERDNVLHSTSGIEALAFVANLQVLNSTANDLLTLERDGIQAAHLAGKKFHIYIASVGIFQLIVLTKRAAAFQVVKPKINSSIAFLAILSETLCNTPVK